METLQKKQLSLISVGHYHPDCVIDNSFLESLDIGVDTNWILERVGIKERRTVLPLDYIRHTRNKDPRAAEEAAVMTNAQTGAKAARMAMERANLSPKDIGMIIAGGCSPSYSIPAEACVIAAELNLECPAFDVSSACSTFAAQTHFLNSAGPGALPDYVLLVSAENTTRRIDYTDRRSAVLWGDGSSAAIVSPTAGGRIKIRRTMIQSEPSGWDKVVIPCGGYFQQDGSAVQTFAIRRTLDVLNELVPSVPGDPRSCTFIGHQANLSMLTTVCRKACVPGGRHFYNVDRYGNCGASGAPTVLSQHWEELPAGELCLAVVGSGLTWGGLLMDVGPMPN